MPKRQKRFKSEKAILKEIDAQEAARVSALQKVELMTEQLKTEVRSGRPPDKDTYETRLAKISVAERSAKRAEAKKKRLGEALSQFKTLLLPMGVEDNSVVL